MIIWGWGGITSTADEGEFTCPDCGPKRYKLKRVRNFFKLYFIPIIPLSVLGEYVECETCKATYNDRILEWDPKGDAERFEAEFMVATKRVMMKVALADGVVDDAEVEAITKIFADLTGAHVDRGDIAAEIEAMKDDKESIQDYVSSLRGHLNEHGKEKVLMAATRIAMSDGDFDRSEADEIMKLGEALEMSKAHIKGILAEAQSEMTALAGEPAQVSAVH